MKVHESKPIFYGNPVVCKDDDLTDSARGARDATSIYAYDYDGQIVGKVNAMSYDKCTLPQKQTVCD